MNKPFLFTGILLAVLLIFSGCQGGNSQVTNTVPAGNTNPGLTGTAPSGNLAVKNFVANVADVPADSMQEFVYEGKNAMLVNFNGQFKAFVNICPHKGLAFDTSSLQGDKIVCPWHGSTFSASDGKNLAGPQGSAATLSGLTMIDLKIENDKIYYVLS